MNAISVIWAPIPTLRNVAEERRLLAGFLVVTANAILGLAGSTLLVSGGFMEAQLEASNMQLPPGVMENITAWSKVAMLLFSTLSPFLWWVLITLVMQLVTRFFGGSGPLSAMFAVVGVAFLPFALSAVISIPAGALAVALGPENVATQIFGLSANLLSLAFLIWHAALVVIGAAMARNISYGESTGSCAVSCAGCLFLIIVVTVAFVAAVAVLAGAAAP